MADVPAQTVAETARLTLRRLSPGDAEFFHRQLNQPSWLANIGDRNVRSTIDAENYIRTRTLASYQEHGFGMYRIERKTDGVPVGLCGLVKRDTLPGPDLGFSLLEDQWGKGYAREAAGAVVAYAFGTLKLSKLLAIVLPANDRSVGLLEKLGFEREGTILSNGAPLLLYALHRPA